MIYSYFRINLGRASYTVFRLHINHSMTFIFNVKSVSVWYHAYHENTNLLKIRLKNLLLKYLPQTSAVTNNPNQNVYHLPPNLWILWHPLGCLATLVFTYQLYCPAHVVFRICCFLLCSSVLCRDYVNTEFSKALGYQ